jgi:hypothetical protein
MSKRKFKSKVPCTKCGLPLYGGASVVSPGYLYACLHCDEDFYGCEVLPAGKREAKL